MIKSETNPGEVQLSKWWRTPSAQAAMKRAAQQKRERIDAMKKQVAERKATVAKEVQEWEVK